MMFKLKTTKYNSGDSELDSVKGAVQRKGLMAIKVEAGLDFIYDLQLQ
jgi:hypothetical protein